MSTPDWRNNTWKPGDVMEYVDMAARRGAPQGRQTEPGLFWYSGFGSGRLFLDDGTILWCNTSEAAAECRRRGLDFLFVDSFINTRHCISLGD